MVPVMMLPMVIGMSGCSFLHSESYTDYEPEIINSEEPKEITYKTDTVKQGSKKEMEEYVFVLQSTKQERLYFKIPEPRIKKIYVEENSHVKKGDMLVELEMGDLEDNIENCKAQIEAKEVELRHVKKLLEIKRSEVPFILIKKIIRQPF